MSEPEITFPEVEIAARPVDLPPIPRRGKVALPTEPFRQTGACNLADPPAPMSIADAEALLDPTNLLNKRYRPVYEGDALYTSCDLFGGDMAHIVFGQVAVPAAVWWTEKALADHVPGEPWPTPVYPGKGKPGNIKEMSAADMYNWACTWGEAYGWAVSRPKGTPVYQDAKWRDACADWGGRLNCIDEDRFVLVIGKPMYAGHGHVVVARPGPLDKKGLRGSAAGAEKSCVRNDVAWTWGSMSRFKMLALIRDVPPEAARRSPLLTEQMILRGLP